jgi:hypothetical protein
LNKANHNGKEIVSKQEFDMQALGEWTLNLKGSCALHLEKALQETTHHIERLTTEMPFTKT